MALPADGPVGAACRGYLRPTIPRLVIEVDAQDGTGLSPAVIDHLVGALAGVVDKPAGIEVQSGTISDPSRGPWTLDAVRTLAAASRTVPQDDQTAVMHVLVLRGEPDQSDPRIADAIGVAFNATEFVVFADRVDSLALLLGGADAVLRAVVTHEAGHLLCLVNISYASDLDHEDPDHPGHSADTNSVMFHAIETTAISQLFSGPPPATFSAADSADLEGLRTGRY